MMYQSQKSAAFKAGDKVCIRFPEPVGQFIFMMLIGGLLMTLPMRAAAAEKEKTQGFNASYFALDNGMEVVVIPNTRAPVITHMVWYRAGAADEPFGKSGIAHVLEHMMFKGTDTYGPGEFSRIVKSLGGRDNAFTSQDYTAYFQSVARQHLEKVMRMEADRMQNLKLDPGQFASERDVVVEERRQRTDNDPRHRFYEQVRHALYVNHAYAEPVIGWKHEIHQLTLKDARSFYDKWYTPSNAILIVSGDITAEALKPLAEKIYGKIPERNVLERKRSTIPAFDGKMHLEFRDAVVRQPFFVRAYRVPGHNQDAGQALALQVLEKILSGGATTRLYKSLVVDQKLATSVSLSYDPDALDEAALWVYAVPAEGVELKKLERALDSELRRIAENGPEEEEVNRAVERLQDEAILARDSLQGPPMIFGTTLTTGGTVEDVQGWPGRLETVSADNVMDVAMAYLHPEDYTGPPPVTGFLMPPLSDNSSEEAP